MSAPAPSCEIPCCSPATTESVAVVRDKIADTRADVLVGQGAILRGQGDSTSAILRDANGNVLALNNAIDRNALGVMSQVDKYGLASLNATSGVNDNVTRSGFAGVAATHDTGDKLEVQANTIAWNQAGLQNAGFAEGRAQNERINDAQTAQSDRASKYLSGSISDNFARLGAQSEAGFYRTGAAVASTDKQVVQSEMALGRATAAGFTDIGNNVRDSYARLSEANCQIKETVAAYGNRASDQTASVLATLSAQHAGITRDVATAADRLGLQAATHYGSLQLEASKNTAAVQLQAAMNSKESLLENSKWFALAEKTAMINKCELEAKIAACCCEVKEAVHGSASATQALIQGNETTRVRDALAAAATESVYLRLKAEQSNNHSHGCAQPPPYPLYPAYPPYPYPHHGSRRGSRS